MLDYVILFHQMPETAARPSHWDLLLEDGDTLLAWAMDRQPCAGQASPAIALPPHRRLYLSFEGPIDGDRGSVERWDAGRFRWVDRGVDRFELMLNGRRGLGAVVIQRTKVTASDGERPEFDIEFKAVD